jgi:hypothetical protein
MPSAYWCGPTLGIGSAENPAAQGLIVRYPNFNKRMHHSEINSWKG